MHKTRYDRLYDLLMWAWQQKGEPFTLTAWGRAVGLKRSSYLAGLCRQLETWGAIERIEYGELVNGLPTRVYRIADRPEIFFVDVVETIQQAAEEQRRGS